MVIINMIFMLKKGGASVKKKFLLIFSVICILAALTVGLVIPVSAAGPQNGAKIDKVNTPNGTPPTSYTAHITITNLNSSDTITITKITDTINHTVAPVEISGNLLPSGNPVTIAANASVTVTYVWNVLSGDRDTNVMDVAYAEGTNNFSLNGHVYPLPFSLNYPYLTYIPLPELPAAALFGLGVVGLGGFVLIKRRTSTAKV
jgi:hypothetical protein